ncbi:MAG: NAD(P)/FAD-dependent oxidoreductase [Candidatus Acidiferrales bacterium]
MVGGSTAGVFAASLLARRGLRVRVFEQAEHLDPTPRTLIVTHRMRELLGAQGEPAIINEIKRFEMFTDGRAATVTLDRPDLIVERARLIRGLVAQAERDGVQFSMGRRFLGLEGVSRGDGSAKVSAGPLRLSMGVSGSSDTEQVAAETLIGADGAQSRVAHAAGWPRLRTVPLIQAIVKMPSDMPSDSVRVWFVPGDTPYFYWLIPESSETAALGLIGEDGHHARECLDRFMMKRHFEPLSFQGARIPVYAGWVPVQRRVGAGRVFLVGDAACQVKVSTVGGIVTGFRGALGICEAILDGGRSRELRSLRRELDMHLLIRRTIHSFEQADYSRLVDLMNASTKRSLSRYSRDEAGRVLWHIALSQPRLLLLGLRGLLAGGSAFRSGARS